MHLFVDKKFPESLLVFLPFTLFFPIGVMYAVIILFIFLWVLSGNYVHKWQAIRYSSIFLPVMILLSLVFFELSFLSSDNVRRWLSVIHYQILLFLLLFLSIGGGSWQQRAKSVFFAGAVYGASVFYLTHLWGLPDWRIFANYAIYAGNKSIALGIFHAIAAAWLLDEAMRQKNMRKKLIQLFFYMYIAVAVLIYAMTRTGILLLLLLSSIVVIRHISFNWRGLILFSVALVALYSAWHLSPVARERAAITVDAVRDFYSGQMGTGQGNRLQFVKITGEMILEKPILGHGIGSWLQQYPVRARGLETEFMSTPHGDYLLYAAELGLIGLIALLGVYAALTRAAWKIGFKHGMGFFLVTTAMMVGGLFNAILRDWKFGMPMMILLTVAFVRDRDGKPSDEQYHSSQLES